MSPWIDKKAIGARVDEMIEREQFFQSGARVCPTHPDDKGCWWVRGGHPQAEGYGCICLVPASLWTVLPEVERIPAEP